MHEDNTIPIDRLTKKKIRKDITDTVLEQADKVANMDWDSPDMALTSAFVEKIMVMGLDEKASLLAKYYTQFKPIAQSMLLELGIPADNNVTCCAASAIANFARTTEDLEGIRKCDS